jgi:hypothetical protein
MTIDAVLHHMNQPPLKLTDLVPRMDAEVAEIIMKGLHSDPDDRWSTVDQMVSALRDAEGRLVKATRTLLTRRKKKTEKKSKLTTTKPKSANKAATDSIEPPTNPPPE